jgi:hypothetical protein
MSNFRVIRPVGAQLIQMRTDGHNGANTAPKKPNERLVGSQLKLSLYSPRLALRAPGGLRFPQILDNRHMKLANLSALRTSRLHPH